MKIEIKETVDVSPLAAAETKRKLENIVQHLGQTSIDDIDRVLQVVQHPKGLSTLKSNWSFIKLKLK